MPRGIPNAKRDETGMKWTTFHSPLALNPKHPTATYLKSESQTLWARKAAASKKASDEEALNGSGTTPAANGTTTTTDQRRGSNVIVIHPGSRYTRIGKASDMRPVSVASVIARRCQPPVPQPVFVNSIIQPSSTKDPFEGVTHALQERRRYYKLDDVPGAHTAVTEFNKGVVPDALENDPFNTEWIRGDNPDDVIVGDKVLKLGDPERAGYSVRWPFRGGTFNTRYNASLQVLLNDFETILRHSLKDHLNVDSKQYPQFSVVLIIQDLYDKNFVREMCNMILMSMGFKQMCVQQESMAATYGAGITSACVVNLGATCSTIACVDEGLVVPDTRLSLAIGGDDITQFLYALFKRASFPYQELDLSKMHDWSLMEELKEKHCTLQDSSVAINTYAFDSRGPHQTTMRWRFQAYDEMVLAPMCLFDIRPIDFDSRFEGQKALMHQDITDEIIDWVGPTITQAMISSTKHLMPTATNTTTTTAPTANGTDNENDQDQEGGGAPALKTEDSDIPMEDDTDEPAGNPDGTGDEKTEQSIGRKSTARATGGDAATTTEATASQSSSTTKNATKAEGSNPSSSLAATATSSGGNTNVATASIDPVNKEYGIDVPFEASKLPLDVAIYNSVRAAGGDDKMKKYLNAVLVIGGTSLVNSMDHALQSRLQGIMGPLFPGIEVQLIPPPKEVDSRLLAWKGAAVLGKMDAANELWVTPADWDVLGLRGVKERCFYL